MQGVRFSGYFYVKRQNPEFDQKVLNLAHQISIQQEKTAEHQAEPGRNRATSASGLSHQGSSESLGDRFTLRDRSNEGWIKLYAYPSEVELPLHKAFKEKGISYQYSSLPKSVDDENFRALVAAHAANVALHHKVEKLEEQVYLQFCELEEQTLRLKEQDEQLNKRRNIFHRLFHRDK